MKYKVIGWTYSDNYNIESAPLTFAARHAIIDDIKENGYFFTGYDHQEAMYGCPVLNDGKKRDCSQRGFAGIMAEAYGEVEPFSYSRYMFLIKPEAKIMPKEMADLRKKEKLEDMVETFSLNLEEKAFNLAITTNEIVIDDIEELRYVETNDIIVLKSNENQEKYIVVDVDRKREFLDKEAKEQLNPKRESTVTLKIQIKKC